MNSSLAATTQPQTPLPVHLLPGTPEALDGRPAVDLDMLPVEAVVADIFVLALPVDYPEPRTLPESCYPHDVTGATAIDGRGGFYAIAARPDLAFRYKKFSVEGVMVAFDARGHVFVCWTIRDLPRPWVLDETIPLPRFPGMD